MQRHVLLRRNWAPFTRTEQARASALLRLAAAASLATGVGQAVMYAAEYGDNNECTPVVYLPVPVDDFVELQNARKVVRVVTLDPDAPE